MADAACEAAFEASDLTAELAVAAPDLTAEAPAAITEVAEATAEISGNTPVDEKRSTHPGASRR